MNIQKGGVKNLVDYIGKYPNVNKDLIDAFNKKIKLENYLDKGAPVIIICLGMSVCYKHKFKFKEKRETYEKCYEKEAELVKMNLIGYLAKCQSVHDFPRKNIILIGCTFKKAFKTIRWLKFDGCQENARFIEIQNNNLITSTAETIQTLLDNDFKVLLFGHSFGGSVCNFVANKLVKNDNLKIFTFGSLYISQKAKKEHLFNIKNYMKDKDVAFAKLTYKCLRDAEGIKDVNLFNENINRLSLNNGRIMFWSKLTDGKSKVTIEDMKLNGIYEEKKFTETEIKDIDTRIPIFTGTIGQWKNHNSYFLSLRIKDVLEFLHLFFDGFPHFYKCKTPTDLFLKNQPPSQGIGISSISSTRTMSTRPLPPIPMPVEDTGQKISEIIKNIDLLEEESVLDVLEEIEKEKGVVEEEQYANLLTSFTDQEFLNTTKILVDFAEKEQEQENIINVKTEQLRKLQRTDVITLLGINRKKLNRKKSKTKKGKASKKEKLSKQGKVSKQGKASKKGKASKQGKVSKKGKVSQKEKSLKKKK